MIKQIGVYPWKIVQNLTKFHQIYVAQNIPAVVLSSVFFHDFGGVGGVYFLLS